MSASYDVALVGAGVDPRRHLTPEARAVLAEAHRVLHLTAHHETIAEAAVGPCEDLGGLYLAVRSSSVYQTMADRVLREATEGPVAFVTYGHPMVLVDTNQKILEQARRDDLRVKVVSGVSSIDVMLEWLTLDVGLAGLQVMEVNQMVALGHYPYPTMACFVLQIGAFGAEDLTLERPNHPRRFERLRDFLLESYAPEHPAVLLTCSFRDDMPNIQYQLPVAELDTAWDRIHTGMSLYLPPTNVRTVDQAFLKGLRQETDVFAGETE